MVAFEYEIRDDLGVHARPAGVLCREAKNFESEIGFIKGETRADVRKILSLMKLGVRKGDLIRVEIVGRAEDAAGEAIRLLLETQL